MGTKEVDLKKIEKIVVSLAATQIGLQEEIRGVNRAISVISRDKIPLRRLLMRVQDISEIMKKEIAALQSELK